MELKLKDYLSKVMTGESQQFKNVTVVPLFFAEPAKADYLTLKEALAKKAITINEVAAGGSVPELAVEVNDDINVLILDGEELMGGKQNRLVNTTILLQGKSRTTVPVSCVEHGRWHHVSPTFADSGNVATCHMRMAKQQSVTHSLDTKQGFRSDQGKVWAGIAELGLVAKVDSSTGAMRDIYESKKTDLNEYLRMCQYRPGQCGMLVFVNGEAVGIDIVSREAAYRVYHEKLLKSYCIDAMYRAKQDNQELGSAKAKEFLEKIADCTESTKYKSVGKGTDYRFKGQGFTGACLEVDDEVIHMAFLSTAKV
jgi:hypothetical protein